MEDGTAMGEAVGGRTAATVAACAAFALSFSIAKAAEPKFQEPDRSELLQRLSPHLKSPAGEAMPEKLRGVDPYKNEPLPSGKPELAMPVGSGTLLAMVSFSDRLELHLSKTGYFRAVPGNPLLSPGHVSIELQGLKAKDLVSFDERIDLARGSVVVELESSDGKASFEISGDMARDCLVVSARDSRKTRGEAVVRYSIWRESMKLGCEGGTLICEEPFVITKPDDQRQSQSLSLSLMAACFDGASFKASAGEKEASITVPQEASGSFSFAIAARCAKGAPPSVECAKALKETLESKTLEAERLAWWSSFWSKSYIDVSGKDSERLARLWHTTLYSYACAGQGPVPPKFNGGPGLVIKDARHWEDGYWWQNQREIIWPMCAAGHPEFARESLLFFNRSFEFSKAEAVNYKFAGLFFHEWTNPIQWGADAYLSKSYEAVQSVAEPYDPAKINPEEALKHRRTLKPGYHVNHTYSSGIELTQAAFDYVANEGDKELLAKMAAPWLKECALLSMSLLTEGPDGKLHALCANANEQWWMVDDPSSLLCAIRYALSMTALHGKELGFEDKLVTDAKARLEKLVPLPTAASWSYEMDGKRRVLGKLAPGDEVFAPFAMAVGTETYNQENPELYAIFPFAMADLNSPPELLKRAIESFRRRVFKSTAGWSQCPVQAARLGLPDAADVIAQHVKNHQKWPYGGWNSPSNMLYAGASVVDCPYFDAAGVQMTALQETLLQSHGPLEGGLFEGGPIRLLPAASESWSGSFKLHARGGFEVTARFSQGKLDAARFIATRDGKLRVVNPFVKAFVWIDGKPAGGSSEKLLALQMKAGSKATIAEGAPR